MEPTTEMLIRNRLSVIEHDLDWIAKRIEYVQGELEDHQKTKILLEGQQTELTKELKDAGKVVENAPVSS